MSTGKTSGAPVLPQVAGVILLTLGLLKLYAWSAGLVSPTQDAVIPMPLSKLALFMGLIEVQAGVGIIFLLRPLRAAQGLALIGASFICYRWLHSLIGGAPCPCLAGATSILPILRMHEDKLLLSLSIWFFLIGALSWVRETRFK